MPSEQRIVTVFGSSRPREGDADYTQVREVEAPDRPSSEVVDSPWREANNRLLHPVPTPASPPTT